MNKKINKNNHIKLKIEKLNEKLNLLNLVKSHHSTRQFTGETIQDSKIEQIIEIVSYAPSSLGKHPVEFINIRDKNTLIKLGNCKAMVMILFSIVMLQLFLF